METERYTTQTIHWPPSGQHILAQYDDTSIVVYQAYRPSIGRFAAKQQYFGGGFRYQRMSWIKPNFLWMMYRSGWGTKEDQEITLAVRLKRPFFDDLLTQAVPSSYDAAAYPTHDAWQTAVKRSDVRRQWDPDHDPTGGKLDRKAIQLGLRGKTLKEYGRDAIIEITDISAFVAEQRPFAHPPYTDLLTPKETIYPSPTNQIEPICASTP